MGCAFATINGTALAGLDYTATTASSTLHLPAFGFSEHHAALLLQVAEDGDGGIVVELLRGWLPASSSSGRHDSWFWQRRPRDCAYQP
jgi:hypothetical protein